MTLEEKQHEMKRIYSEALLYKKKVDSILKLPETKSQIIAIKKANKVVDFALKVRVLQVQFQTILAQHIPKYEKGGIDESKTN